MARLSLLCLAVCTSTAGAQPAPGVLCGDAPRPALHKVAADSTSVGGASVAHVPEGIVFSFVGHGSFAIPSRTPTSSSSHTEVASSWGYLLAGDKLTTIGELGRGGGGRVVSAGGTALVHNADGTYSQCQPGGRKPLPASSRKARLVADVLAGRTLTVVLDEEGPRIPCGGRLSTPRERTAWIDTLSLDTAAWGKLAARTIKPAAGPGCRDVTIMAALASPTEAAIAHQTCVVGDAGDSVSIGACSIAFELWSATGWRSMPPQPADAGKVLLASSGGVVRAVVGSTQGDFIVYRLSGSAPVAETPKTTGYPLAISGAQLLVGTPDGKRAGSIGIGWRLRVHELTGTTWKPAADFVDVDHAHAVAVAWQDKRTVVVAPEDQRNRNPVSARVLERANGTWRDLPAARATIAPP